MTDTPTKQEIQSKNDNVPAATPVEQKKNNRNDRKRNRRGDSKNLERDSDWQERVVQIRRVSKTVKGGKKMSFRAIVVVGNEKGQVGVGVGKADDVVNAFKKAKADGRKNLINIPITKALSIPHDVTGSFGACKIIMRPSIEGSGVIAGGAVRTVLEVAGIKNVIAKQLGSNNILNNARAAVSALDNLTTRTEVAKKRDLQ